MALEINLSELRASMSTQSTQPVKVEVPRNIIASNVNVFSGDLLLTCS